MIFAAVFSGLALGLAAYLVLRRFFDRVSAEKPRWAGSPVSTPSILKTKLGFSEIRAVNRFLDRHAMADRLSLLLKTAKWNISVSVFLLGCFVAGAFCFLLLQSVTGLWGAAVLSAAAAAAPFFYLSYIRRRYLGKFAEYLPNALGIISSAIRAGRGLESAIDTVAQMAPHPVSDEFGVVHAEMKLGTPLPKALGNLYDRIKNPELKIFVTGITIHRELGGNLSEILDNLEKTIRERFAVLREAHALSAQGRISSWVLFAIPIALVAMYLKSNPRMFMDFLHSRQAGFIVWPAVLLDLAGFLWIRNIAQLKD